VQIAPPLLPHLAFYEALAVLDESNSAWSETVAGLLTLRLFDTWGEMVRRGERVQAWEVTGVAEAVDELPETHPARAALRAVVDAVRTPDAAPAAALAHLSNYARALRFDAQWLLAADVFATMLSYAYGAPDDLVISAAYHRGYCLRMAGHLDAAAASYDEGRAIAASCGNEAGLLEADVSHAALALHRGNLPAAESLLDGVIQRADPATCGRVLARALHDRATVAARRGSPEEAAVFGCRALALFETGADRDRVLSDLAAALGDAGQYDAAWDALLVLAGTAEEQEVRWVATVNLTELATVRGDERLFDQFRAQLADAALPAWLTAHFELSVGCGAHRFGRRSAAIEALRKAVRVATQYGVNEVRVRAEVLLTAIEREPAGDRVGEPTVSSQLAEVLHGVRALRELTGVNPG
jgi:tetratricopeptide (TPR) repeat protein